MKHGENERARSGFSHDWSHIPVQVDDLNSIIPTATIVSFNRVKKSHEGIREFQAIKRLFAYNVDDSFINEISSLHELTYLWAETVTAEDLTPLARLGSLEYMILRRVRNAKCFMFACEMPNLRHLNLEWVKNLSSLADLSMKKNLLSFGIEGATPVNMTQKVDSLIPILDWPDLHSLFLTNTMVADGNLRCLAQISSLRYLETSRFYPKSEFVALKEARPELKCQWFENYEIKAP